MVGVVYRMLGDLSTVDYGFEPGAIPPLASSLGARWRAVVRDWTGAEVVATLGPTETNHFTWGPLTPVTGTSISLTQPTSQWTSWYNRADVYGPSNDVIYVWINPAAAIVTNAAGERSVSWSWRSECGYPGGCPDAPYAYGLLAGWLDGSLAPPTNTYDLGVLDAFDAADRAAILAYHPAFDPPGRDPATIADDPRFLRLGAATVAEFPAPSGVPPVSWTPCDGTLTDDAFVPLHAGESPFGARETLVVQHGVLSTTAACTPQQPRLSLGTGTAGCAITAEVLVDTMFGTLLMLPGSVSPECTRP